MRCLSPLPRTISDGPASPSSTSREWTVAISDSLNPASAPRRSMSRSTSFAAHMAAYMCASGHGRGCGRVLRTFGSATAGSSARRPVASATGKNRRAYSDSPCASPPSRTARPSNALDPLTSRHRAIYPGAAPRALSCTAATSFFGIRRTVMLILVIAISPAAIFAVPGIAIVVVMAP